MDSISTTNDDLKSRILKLFIEDSFCDVTFRVDNPPHRCSSHKLILASGSKVFEAMLYGKMAEKCEIRIPDVTARGFHTMLRYLYSDTAKFENELHAFETAYCAKKYLIDNLLGACESYLNSQVVLNIETVLTLYEKAEFLELKTLQKRCLRYVSRHASKILSSPRMCEISEATFQNILKLDFMDIESEKRIVESVWKWGEEQCKVKGMDKSSKNIRNLTGNLLKHVRFLSLSFKQLEDIFHQFEILDNAEQLAVLWNVALSIKGESVRLPLSLGREFKNRSINNVSKLKIPTEYRYNGDMTSISTMQFKQQIDIFTNGSGVTIFGVVVAMKPIPCYSSTHRQLKTDITLCNETTKCYSRTNLLKKHNTHEFDDQIEEVLFDEFLHLGKGDIGSLAIEATGEGVRIMECMEDEFSLRLENTIINWNFKVDGRKSRLFPIKEVICMPD